MAPGMAPSNSSGYSVVKYHPQALIGLARGRQQTARPYRQNVRGGVLLQAFRRPRERQAVRSWLAAPSRQKFYFIFVHGETRL
jgi:hypothetical protein